MERVFVKKYAEFLTAYSDGKTIQCAMGDTGDWYDIEIEQIFDYVYPQLRIKPEIKRIALTMQDLIDRELSGKTMRLSNGDFIWSWDDKYIRIINAYIAYDYLLESNSTFLDGTPCYKEMESE